MPVSTTVDRLSDAGCRRPLSRPGRVGRRLACLVRAIAISLPLVSLGGCIALAIPSQRHFDPQDRGGLFGEFRPYQGGDNDTVPVGHGGPGKTCFQDDPVMAEEEPEVPWPRFHPIPTRPVFSLPEPLAPFASH